MEIHVLLFSVLREKTGQGSLTVSLEAPVTGADLLDHLTQRFPVIGAYREVIRLAVNESYAAEQTVLQEGDEVALITPVSGG